MIINDRLFFPFQRGANKQYNVNIPTSPSSLPCSHVPWTFRARLPTQPDGCSSVPSAPCGSVQHASATPVHPPAPYSSSGTTTSQHTTSIVNNKHKWWYVCVFKFMNGHLLNLTELTLAYLLSRGILSLYVIIFSFLNLD